LGWKKVLEINAKRLKEEGKTYADYTFFEYGDVVAIGKYATNPTDAFGNCVESPTCDLSKGELIVTNTSRFKVFFRVIHATNGGNCIIGYGTGCLALVFYRFDPQSGNYYEIYNESVYPFKCKEVTGGSVCHANSIACFNNSEQNVIYITEFIVEVDGKHVTVTNTYSGAKIEFDLPDQPLAFSIGICMGSGYGALSLENEAIGISRRVEVSDISYSLGSNQFFTGFEYLVLEVYDYFEDLMNMFGLLMNIMMYAMIIMMVFSMLSMIVI